MDLIIGATSRVAREYVNHRSNRNVESFLVSRSGTEDLFSDNPQVKGHVVQDLTKQYWGSLEGVLNNEDISRIIYFAVAQQSKSNPEACFQVNTKPLARILDLVDLKNLPFVYLSSDMVFGKNESPFSEDDIPISPFGDYGLSKRRGEEITLTYDKGFVVRLGNVLGIRDDFLTSVVKSLKEGREFGAWDNVYNRFASIDEVSLVLDKLRDYNGNQRIFHAASDDRPFSRYNLSSKFVHMCQCEKILPWNSVEKIKSIQHDFKDERPQNLALDTKITSKELGFRPKPILFSLVGFIKEKKYPYTD